MSTYFPNVPKVKYEGPKTDNPFAFRFYEADRIIAGKPMKDHLKFALSWWHTLCAGGADPFGVETMDRSYGGLTDPMASAMAKVDAGFEFMEKLGIEYFCFHDADVAPAGETFEETRDNFLTIIDYIKSKMEGTNIKCLWGTSNCFTHPVSCTAQAHPAAPMPLLGQLLKSKMPSMLPSHWVVRVIHSGVVAKVTRPS